MTKQPETLRLRINPNNRSISVSDPEYIAAWTAALEKRRGEIEAELKEKVANGELEIPTVEHKPGDTLKTADAMQTTPEDGLRFWSHSLAENDMQDWAVKRGIGMVGMSGGWDHGRVIEYIDDPEVPFLEFEIEQAA